MYSRNIVMFTHKSRYISWGGKGHSLNILIISITEKS